MRVYYWLVFILTILPYAILAQVTPGDANGTNGNGALNGAGGYGAGWWFWTILLLAIVALIVWWAVRAGSAGAKGSPPPSSRGDAGRMQGGT